MITGKQPFNAEIFSRATPPTVISVPDVKNVTVTLTYSVMSPQIGNHSQFIAEEEARLYKLVLHLLSNKRKNCFKKGLYDLEIVSLKGSGPSCRLLGLEQ